MTDHSGFDPSDVYVYRGKGRVPRNVRHVEVDRAVKFIPARLFQECRQLESVLLHEGLLRIGRWAFYGCTSLRMIQCPSTVTEICEGAFWGCSNLATVELPQALEEIENWTFRECRSLEAVKIPASVTRIGSYAFYGCTNLPSLELREGLRMIGDYAFSNCRSLGSLWVPLSVIEIGSWAFDGCSSLSLARLHDDLPRMRLFAFGGCTSLELFEFVGLSERLGAIRMDNQTKSRFEGRLSEMTLALTREEDEDNDVYDDEEDPDAVWEKCKESLGRAHDVLTYIELKGATPVLEMALWKAKIEGEGEEGVQRKLVGNKDGGQDPSNAGRKGKRPEVMKNICQDARLSREDCRVKCGAGIVIPEMLKFFTYSSSWPELDDSDEGNVH